MRGRLVKTTATPLPRAPPSAPPVEPERMEVRHEPTQNLYQRAPMSAELLVRAAKSNEYRTATHKIAMLCFADSAQQGTFIGFPGMENLLEWTGVTRSQVYRILADLAEQGIIKQVKRGSRGTNAEFLLWPDDAPSDGDGELSHTCDNPKLVPKPSQTRPKTVPESRSNRDAYVLRTTNNDQEGLLSSNTHQGQPCVTHFGEITPCFRCGLDARLEAQPEREPLRPTADVARGAAAAREALRTRKANA